MNTGDFPKYLVLIGMAVVNEKKIKEKKQEKREEKKQEKRIKLGNWGDFGNSISVSIAT